MNDDKCLFCNGSGYKSAAENMPSDTPSILMPIGTWPCPGCNGTGKRKNISVDLSEAIKQYNEKD